MSSSGRMKKETGENAQQGDDEMTKYILSGISGTYVLLALAFTASYTWQYATVLSLVTLIPSAIEHGYMWPVWLFELDHLA